MKNHKSNTHANQRRKVNLNIMEPESELRIVRWSIIITIVASVMGLGIYDLVYFLKHEKETMLATTSVMSGFGEITLFNTAQDDSFSKNVYKDNDLGFKISIPSDSWNIHSMSDDLDNDNIQALKTKGFLDGIYLAQNNKTRFMVAVFDISQKSSFELSNYIDTQIETMNNTFGVDVPIKQVSASNDWAIFGAHAHSETQDEYGEQLLYLENNRLYMLQYTGLSPSEMETEIKSEYRSIIDSFEILG